MHVDAESIMPNNNTIDYAKLKAVAKTYGCGCGEVLARFRKQESRGIIALYGNCQINIYSHMIRSSPKLMHSYILLWFSPVQVIHGEEEKVGFEKELIENIDILIYQEVIGNTSISKALNTKDIVSRMRRDAISICIPNIYFDGYFPQLSPNPYNVFYKDERGITVPAVPYGDTNIEKYTRGGQPAEKIAEMISDKEFYSLEQCEEVVENSLNNLRSRESRCHVTISDYIFAKFQEEYLFYTPNHPKTYVVYELFTRILKCISMKKEDAIMTSSELDIYGIPIYPSVHHHLKLKFDYPAIYWNKDLCKVPSTILEYVSAYLHYCGRRILTNTTEKEILPYVANHLLLGERDNLTLS